MTKPTDISAFKVMRGKCPTCPFREENIGQSEIADTVRARALTASQICHHPRLKGEKETSLCRGSRDFQLQLLHKMGFLPEPTDAAWATKREEFKC